ncbi:hypothetical protein [Halodurantibacterium flavum]|uniref:Uncharacterized protein n=1 Tax=Halodurantibacterium flavum TaxID=1382802 RepID=A0ABW4S0H8_9RHOB
MAGVIASGAMAPLAVFLFTGPGEIDRLRLRRSRSALAVAAE